MGEHIDYRAARKKKLKEHDTGARHERITFKRYLRELEEQALLDSELNAIDSQLPEPDSTD